MLTGELRSKIDALWNAFWSGGISNPLEVIEQITYLLFLKRLDELQTLEENKAAAPRAADRAPRLPRGQRPQGPPLRGSALVALQALRGRARCSTVVERARLPLPAHARRRRLDLRAPHEGRALHHPHAGAARQGRRHDRRTCRWRTATPRATSTSTCSARSPAPGRTASSAPRATSSS